MNAYRHGAAAILRKISADASMCCGHREYALPSGRKDDPSFDMGQFRLEVAEILAGKVAPPAQIASSDGQSTLARGDSGEGVRDLQGKLKVSASGRFDGATEAAVRDFQRQSRLVPDGIVGPKTWGVLKVG
jgi:murein L,D-transpeptidase YcbB/YkuD